MFTDRSSSPGKRGQRQSAAPISTRGANLCSLLITRGRGSGGQLAYALAHFVSERYVHAREAVCLRPAETALSVHGNVTPQARQSVNHHRLELALLGRRNS